VRFGSVSHAEPSADELVEGAVDDPPVRRDHVDAPDPEPLDGVLGDPIQQREVSRAVFAREAAGECLDRRGVALDRGDQMRGDQLGVVLSLVRQLRFHEARINQPHRRGDERQHDRACDEEVAQKEARGPCADDGRGHNLGGHLFVRSSPRPLLK
jgi:hypothetical protein